MATEKMKEKKIDYKRMAKDLGISVHLLKIQMGVPVKDVIKNITSYNTLLTISHEIGEPPSRDSLVIGKASGLLMKAVDSADSLKALNKIDVQGAVRIGGFYEEYREKYGQKRESLFQKAFKASKSVSDLFKIVHEPNTFKSPYADGEKIAFLKKATRLMKNAGDMIVLMDILNSYFPDRGSKISVDQYKKIVIEIIKKWKGHIAGLDDIVAVFECEAVFDPLSHTRDGQGRYVYTDYASPFYKERISAVVSIWDEFLSKKEWKGVSFENLCKAYYDSFYLLSQREKIFQKMLEIATLENLNYLYNNNARNLKYRPLYHDFEKIRERKKDILMLKIRTGEKKKVLIGLIKEAESGIGKFPTDFEPFKEGLEKLKKYYMV